VIGGGICWTRFGRIDHLLEIYYVDFVFFIESTFKQLPKSKISEFLEISLIFISDTKGTKVSKKLPLYRNSMERERAFLRLFLSVKF
jgi:hypothetical protein